MVDTQRRLDSIAIVEACYRAEVSDERWLADLFDVARPLLNYGPGVGFALVKWSESERKLELVRGEGFSSDLVRLQIGATQGIEHSAFLRVWYPAKPIIYASNALRRFQPPSLKTAFFEQLGLHGAKDALGFFGHPGAGRSFMLTTLLPKRQSVERGALQTFARVRIHLETALRLRLQPRLVPVAVFTPHGSVLHVEKESSSSQDRNMLVDQVSRIEKARSPRRRAGAEEALLAWRAVVDGRWTVAERVDTDGKRFYFAYEVAVDAPRYGGLTALEARLLELAAQGLTGKHSAYALGISEARVSRGLADGAARLGFASISDAVRLAAHVLRGGVQQDELRVPLTQAERDVLLVLQQGWSNRRIASARATSAHTIAKQVAAILRKTGRPSRRALLSLDGDTVALSKK
jgi:DNA-binding NarL/FixJ family response regulator